MGLVDFGKDLVGTAANVVKGAAYVANPTHLDDIAEGGVKAAQFVAKHPGQTFDIAKTVATEVGKDMLDPKQLALTAGLALATGGVGVVAGAAAKSALAAESVATGVKVARGLTTAAKTADKIGDTVKVADKVGDAAKVIDKASDTASTLSKAGRIADKALGAEKTAGRLNTARNPISAARGAMGQRILQGGATPGAPSMARQVASAAVTGTGRLAPTQAAGMSDNVYAMQKNAWRAQRVMTRGNQTQMAQTGAEIGANPVGYAADRAEEQVSKRIDSAGHAAAYTDRGATVESLYGSGSTQTTAPSSSTQTAGGSSPSMAKASLYSSPGGLTQPGTSVASNSQVGTMYRPRSGEFQAGTQAATPLGGGGSFGPPKTPPPLGFGGGSAGGEPAGGNGWQQPQYPSATLPSIPGAGSNAPQQQTGSRTARRGGGGGAQTHMWMGPHTQAFGGIKSDYDWRSIDPLRPITAGGKVYNATDPQTSGAWGTRSSGLEGQPAAVGQSRTQRRGSNANAMNAAPGNFSPEVGKDGAYAVSQGQSTADTALPITMVGTPEAPMEIDMRTPEGRAAAQKLIGRGGSNVRSGG